MMYWKYIRASIKSKMLFTLLSMVQIAITIILIVEVLVSLSTINYKERELKSEVGIDLDNTYQFMVYGNDNGIVDYRNELSEYVDIGSYRYDRCSINELENNQELINMMSTEDEKMSDVPILKADNNIFNMLDIQIVEGLNLKEEDFSLDEGKMPIIFSEEYKGIVNIGDVLTSELLCVNIYEVIGFYNKDIKWIPPNGVEFFGLEDLGKMAITMPSKEEKGFALYEKAVSNSTYITSDSLSGEEIKRIAEEINKDYGFNIEILSIQDILDRFKQGNYSLIMQNVFFSIFMIISACLGLTTNMSFSVIKRKREFGVRLANGFTKKDIKLLVLSEMLFITSVSTIVAMVFKLSEVYANKQIGIIEKVLVPQFTISDFIISIILVILIMLISSIVPLRSIENLQPKELIGGIE